MPPQRKLFAAMASKDGGAYGTPAGDTDFRKSTTRKRKKYVRQPTGNEALISARKAALDVSDRVGKVQLVPAGSSTGKRGRGAGFYCEACDLTFKDNKQFIDHLNTMQHLIATGHTGKVQRATVQEEEKKKVEKEEEAKAKLDYGEDVRIEGEHDEDDMMAQMGFTGIVRGLFVCY
ncbi:unnamed protein product [Parascedosporium putredinis]|uniref:C2H2-type domain-containing protein n=1 Tax=Parascedosporium putredinis TaxID=1442378 RepID=A0A9P1M971_9PEZI|nr:unnamed protein product [Parascedosporium putredinis]CAI7995150.1 unnamed protein product [Parascedosporium putredinis]